jgi:outer membrane protein assembly factor BamA
VTPAAALLFSASLAIQAPAGKIGEIRVHGNATITDDVVIQLAGLSVGATVDDAGLAAAEKRLRDSGRFDEVQVRKRYRTLAMDDVAIVLLVHEKPGVSPSGQPPSTFRKIRTHLMYFPIVYYDDGYGWTYGARTSLVNIAGKGTHIAVPLTWGADKHASLEVDRTFNTGPLTRITGSYGILQRENTFYRFDDQRVPGPGRAERACSTVLRPTASWAARTSSSDPRSIASGRRPPTRRWIRGGIRSTHRTPRF